MLVLLLFVKIGTLFHASSRSARSSTYNSISQYEPATRSQNASALSRRSRGEAPAVYFFAFLFRKLTAESAHHSDDSPSSAELNNCIYLGGLINRVAAGLAHWANPAE